MVQAEPQSIWESICHTRFPPGTSTSKISVSSQTDLSPLQYRGTASQFTFPFQPLPTFLTELL